MRAVLVLALAGCGAHVSDGADSGTVDAPGSRDAAVVDTLSPVVDAAPCIEGEARMSTASGCFAAFTSTTFARSEARAKCASLGMHLAYVRSADDEAAVASLANGVDVAIGLSDVATEGVYVWDDGTPLGSYTDWHMGEPNNGLNVYEEDCIIYAGATGGQWDDRPCAPPPDGSGAYGVVCQR